MIQQQNKKQSSNHTNNHKLQNKSVVNQQEVIIREQNKFQQMYQTFIGEHNLNCLCSELKMSKEKVLNEAKKYLVESICEKSKYFLPVINQLFIYHMNSRDIHPYSNTLFQRNDGDQIIYDQMTIKNMYDYKQKDIDMNKIIAMNNSIIKQQILPQRFRYLKKENTRDERELEPPVYGTYSYLYEFGDSTYKQMEFSQTHNYSPNYC